MSVEKTMGVEEINYCDSITKVIESHNFLKIFDHILEKNKIFNKEYHLNIFKKIGNELITEKEKSDLTKLLNDEGIKESWEKIRKKLEAKSKVNINIESVDIESISRFQYFIKEILSDNEFKYFKEIIGNFTEETKNDTKEILETK